MADDHWDASDRNEANRLGWGEDLQRAERREAERFGCWIMGVMFAVAVISIGMWCAYG